MINLDPASDSYQDLLGLGGVLGIFALRLTRLRTVVLFVGKKGIGGKGSLEHILAGNKQRLAVRRDNYT